MIIAVCDTSKPPHLYISDDDDFEHHGAAILLLVRDGLACNWKALCRAFRFDRDPRPFHSGHVGLKHTIEELIGVGLLRSADSYTGPYEVTDEAFAVLHALGISLTQAANMPYVGGMAVRPAFGKPSRLQRAAHAFVLMPFTRELGPVYNGPIRAACRKMKLSAKRADDIFSSNELIGDIWNAIVNSFVVIADCTGRNPNVFYELGIAHTLGKPAILITQQREDIPSDVMHVRYLTYSLSPSGLAKLELALHNTLQEIVQTVWSASSRRK